MLIPSYQELEVKAAALSSEVARLKDEISGLNKKMGPDIAMLDHFKKHLVCNEMHRRWEIDFLAVALCPPMGRFLKIAIK